MIVFLCASFFTTFQKVPPALGVRSAKRRVAYLPQKRVTIPFRNVVPSA